MNLHDIPPRKQPRPAIGRRARILSWNEQRAHSFVGEIVILGRPLFVDMRYATPTRVLTDETDGQIYRPHERTHLIVARDEYEVLR